MKVKSLIEYLQDFDPEQEVVLFELSDFYDTMFIGISEKDDKVEILIKNIERIDEEGPLQ